MSSKQVNPILAGIVIVVFLALVVVAGMAYMNTRNDPVKEAMEKKVRNAQASGVYPQLGQPPRPGATDYAPSTPITQAAAKRGNQR